MAHRITDKCIGCRLCAKICPTGAIQGKPRQRHRVIEQRCIDCRACGRVCPQGAVYDQNGRLVERVRFRNRWEKPVIDAAKCIACNICIDVCPTRCLGLGYTRSTESTDVVPKIAAPRDCIACAFCMNECPTSAIRMVAPET